METQVLFMLRDDDKDLSSISRAPIEQQKEFWAQRFRDAGWQADRFLAGLKTAEDFYCQEILQVRTETWYNDRVVLLGDAGYCPSPLKGMGTTASFVGAHVLGGEIMRNLENISQAFENYDQTLRPFVNEIQKVNTSLIRWALPTSQWGVAIWLFVAKLICFFRFPEIAGRLSSE
jgi:2-polyprenyl-6-methoxyphenol hydroxylase-like FAD-dependent oxidoreductase